MRIKKGELILSDDEIDKLVIHKLKMIEDVFENQYEEVANNQFDISSLKFFRTDDSALSKRDERETELLLSLNKKVFTVRKDVKKYLLHNKKN